MYVVAEKTLCGYQPHWFEDFAQYKGWAKSNPHHGHLVAQGQATMEARMNGQSMLTEIDHRRKVEVRDATH